MKVKNILITGASGFIGGFLVKEALSRGYQVWAGVRKRSNVNSLKELGVNVVVLDYADSKAMAKTLNDINKESPFDYVVHNAGLTKSLHKEDFMKVNALYTKNLLDAFSIAKISLKKFLLMSSLSTFTPDSNQPYSRIQLSDPQRPDTLYGKSKLQAEEYVRNQSHCPYIILRPTGVYGPGEKDYFLAIKAVKSGLNIAAGRNPQLITFIYVRDLAQLVLDVLENEDVKNRAFFVSDGDEYTDEQFTRMIQDILKKRFVWNVRVPLPIVKCACQIAEKIGSLQGKVSALNSDKYKIFRQRNWTCEIEDLKKILHFQPQYNLRSGLTETIEWYKEHNWL